MARGSFVKCRSIADAHIPEASAPQVACDASNLVLDPRRMHPARCPRHRPRYMCATPTYNSYDPGAFAVACAWEPPALEAYPRDHLRDVMASFVGRDDGQPPQVPLRALSLTTEGCLRSCGSSHISDLT